MSDEMKNEQQIIRDWYIKEYPADEIGAEIDENATFRDLFYALDCYKDVCEIIGVEDSIIRERVFARPAYIMDVDYKYIYEQCLLCN